LQIAEFSPISSHRVCSARNGVRQSVATQAAAPKPVPEDMGPEQKQSFSAALDKSDVSPCLIRASFLSTLQFRLVHLIHDKNLNTQSLLQHITSKNTSNVFT
jgi:hypothetical protein